jgi:hypothetical protein
MDERRVRLTEDGIGHMMGEKLNNPENLILESLVGKELPNGKFEFPVAWWSERGNKWRYDWNLYDGEIEYL